MPTAHMPFPPPRARGEGGVTSLLRIVGTAATKALNGPVAEIVLTARRARIGGCAPGETRWGHGSRGYSRKIRVKKAESGQIWSGFALGPIGEMAKPERFPGSTEGVEPKPKPHTPHRTIHEIENQKKGGGGCD